MIKYGKWIAVGLILAGLTFSIVFIDQTFRKIEDSTTRNARLKSFESVLGYMFLVTFLLIFVICLFLYR